MLTILFEIIFAALLFRKKTPVRIVVGITAIVLLVLVVTVVKNAVYVPD